MRRITVGLLLLLALGAGAATGEDRAPSPEVERARRELLDALGAPPAAAAETGGPRVDVDAGPAGVERLRLHDVRVRVTGLNGNALQGVTVRALHDSFDLAAAPVETNTLGRAVVRLPRGAWRVDVSRVDPDEGRCVFARVRLEVDPAAEQRIELPERRTVRFRSQGGAFRAPGKVTLAAADFSTHVEVPQRDGAFDVITAPGAPLVLQALRAPDATDGYVLRRQIGAGTTTIVTDAASDPAAPSTPFVFRGDERREVAPTLVSVDALPFDLSFATRGTRTVFVSGVPQVAVSMTVRRDGVPYSFYALPFTTDGKPRTFTGEPPFAVSVGRQHNTFSKYGARRGTVSFRVFLREENGLVLRGASKDAPYQVAWAELLDGKQRAAGTMTKGYLARTPAIEGKDVARLRYRLRIRGPGEDREVEVEPHGQVEKVSVGKVGVRAYPEVAPNARLWAACVNDGVHAWEAVCTTRRARVDVTLFSEMPPGLGGWGGWNGANGFMFLPEGRMFGFVVPCFYDGLLGHELGHTQGFMHGNAAQKRVMDQACRRASRRYAAIRPGVTRLPEGNRFLPVLEAVTRGDLRCDVLPAETDDPDAKASHDSDSGPASDLEPDLETTGEDDFLTWYLRAGHGVDADRRRRASENAWRWWLTIRGYTDDEIQAAVLSRAAGENLAWLARLRGIAATDARVAAAVTEVSPEPKSAWVAARSAALSRWKKRKLGAEKDLDVVHAALLAEVGSRETRVALLRAIGDEHLSRGERGAAHASYVAALAEARRGSDDLFEETLAGCAAEWARR